MQVRVDQRVTNRKSLYFFCEFSLHRLWQKSNLSTKLLSGRHSNSRQLSLDCQLYLYMIVDAKKSNKVNRSNE